MIGMSIIAHYDLQFNILSIYKYVYGKDTFCIHFMYVSIDSVYKFRIFNKQFIFEHFLKKLMYTKCIRKKLIIRNVYGIFKLNIFRK
ncbi:hypothetical protein GLOIN_2v859372 [Rhizophagus irregularis DAOM 181602=DAOM 197198]|nr:hypothetical protein GLOIN_2v859372 [Rhizophagus irregularis DAOM 181602=DAOM 197198]